MRPPVLTPIEKRQVLVKSYLDSFRRAGIKISMRDVERQVIADCEIVDSAERSGELAGGGRKDPSPGRVRPDVIAQAEQATGVKLGATPDLWRPRFRFGNPQQVSEQWGYAVARWFRILEEGVIATPTGRQYVGKLGPLAREAATIEACFQLRGVPAAKRGFVLNEFDGLKDRDAARLYMRRVIDVCDRSTGVLGSWYVK